LVKNSQPLVKKFRNVMEGIKFIDSRCTCYSASISEDLIVEWLHNVGLLAVT